ncbi:MAG: DUF2791 family P-loop domain-containing protein [Eubacteriales bacterium]|nr:DUF2791 family P-loop domain-containing protein [Eubacteriales bacterium]
MYYLGKEEWLGTIRKDYLNDFIKSGGAAVKFGITDDSFNYAGLLSEIRGLAEQDDYVFAYAEATSTKIHMIDKLFHKISKQIDWDNLAYSTVRRIFSCYNYKMPDERNDFNIEYIAGLNNREEIFLRKELHSCLEKEIFHDYEMSQEFRIAMIRLCLDQLDSGGPSVFLSNAVKEWLRGELRLISALKEALIYQKIARHNARHMLYSLPHWLRINGKNGLVLVLDINRYFISKRPEGEDDSFYYSTPATLDVYELLRQFIDSTDEVEGLLVIVLAGKEMLISEKRGVNRYDALKLRIWDEVRDTRRQNPLASMVRITDSNEVAGL